MSDQTVISCQQLSKVYQDANKKITVFENLSLSIKPGQTIAIMGASGSGKSTLLHLLGGLDTPTQGEVLLNGVSLSGASAKKRGLLRNRHLGFVYQFHHLLPEFSALENVMMPLLISKTPRKQATEKATAILEEVGLGDRLTHRPSQLSGGERQRTAIARALVNQPGCILADEPTGNLDEATAAAVMERFTRLNQLANTALVVVTHDPKVAATMDQTYVLKQGVLTPSA